MIVKAKWSTVGETHWDEYATRSVFGGLVTLLAVFPAWIPVMLYYL